MMTGVGNSYGAATSGGKPGGGPRAPGDSEGGVVVDEGGVAARGYADGVVIVDGGTGATHGCASRGVRPVGSASSAARLDETSPGAAARGCVGGWVLESAEINLCGNPKGAGT